MGDSVLLVEKEPPIGWLIFNRPEKLNALSTALWSAIPEGLAELEADPEIRVIVVRGAGERAFSAGADIGEFKNNDRTTEDQAPKENRGSLFHVLDGLAHCTKPTIAMIHGVCMGGGCAAALSIDLRVASEDAVFAITPARLGLGYSFEGIERAVQELGPANARYLLITAGTVDAQKALEMGLVQEVHAPDELESATRALAMRVAQNAPKTIRAVRESIRQSVLPPEDRQLEIVNGLIRECFESEDFKEGVRAFAEKRKPRFKDR